jgi:prevent-host-death family protein
MKTISQRELRNDSGEIMRGLARGESYRVTSRGVPVGMLGPVDASELDELTLRSGTGLMSFPDGVRVSERTDQVLTELRGDR